MYEFGILWLIALAGWEYGEADSLSAPLRRRCEPGHSW